MLKAFRKQKYYHENFGTYKILKIWVRTDYNKKDALVDINDVEFFYSEIVKKILDNDSDYSY